MTPAEKLLHILECIKGNGSFACTGEQPFVLPGLTVKGMDSELSFPIHGEAVRDLIKLAHKAPFGKGAETILDDKVRRVWEIDAAGVEFRNPVWMKTLASMVTKVKAGLGMEKGEVQANLYKLLIYEEGGFFLPHKDSEKEAGMFATLLINLPAAHTGGELEVRFDDQNLVFDTSKASPYQLHFTAFYADCEHEVKPLTSGYRVCLAYNLVLNNPSKPGPTRLSKEREKLAACLKEMEKRERFPKIVLLGHQYTPTNFSFENLKLHDRPRTQAFLQAAELAGYYAKPVLYTSYQMGELEIEGYHWDYHYHDDEKDLSSGTMGELYDSYTEVKHWMEGGMPGLGYLELDDTQILKAFKLNEGEPIIREAEGYTGNAGMELEYWYHYGAICFWPKKQHAEIWKQLHLETQLDWLGWYVKQETGEANKWLADLLGLGLAPGKDQLPEQAFSPLAVYLTRVKDERLLDKLIHSHLIYYFTALDVETLQQLVETFEWKTAYPLFEGVILSGQLEDILLLLAVMQKDSNNKETRIIQWGEVAQNLPVALERLELHKFKGKQKQLQKLLADLIRLTGTLALHESWIRTTTDILLKNLTSDYIEDIFLPVLKEDTLPDNQFLQIIRSACREFLENQVKIKPFPPANWQRPYPPEMRKSRNVAEQVALLIPFLDSPVEQVLDYRKGKPYRDNMTGLIKQFNLDISTTLIAKGSPHTLRLTKNQASYEKALSQWENNLAMLKSI